MSKSAPPAPSLPPSVSPQYRHKDDQIEESAELLFDLHAGSHEFYEDPHYYDYEFKSRKEDVNFYTDRYLEVDGWSLELGVGTGRIAAPAVRAGARVIGLDIHDGMLKVAHQRRAEMSKSKRARFRLCQGDMRTFDLGEQFALISLPFNALQHLYSLSDARACLHQVYTHLKPGGTLIFDVLRPDFSYLARPADAHFQGIDFKHPTWNATYNYSEQSAYDQLRQLNQIWFHYERVDPAPGIPCEAPEYHCIQLSHRYYFPQELSLLLEISGFNIIHVMGDFDGGEITTESESMIYFCERT